VTGDAAVTVLRAEDHVRMAWANGGGTTYQVATSPPGAGLDAFDWRVSLADVEADGAFSSLPGVDRILVLVEGAAMDLVVDGRAVRLGPFEPVRFDGAAETSCVLTAGPTRDLNVMTRRGRCTAVLDVVRVDGGLEVTPDDDGTLLVVVLAGGLEVDGPELLLLRARDAVVARRTTRLRGTGTLARIGISTR
jgi:environmental stress-induced protein Ves